MCKTPIGISLSNCYVTQNIANELATVISQCTDLKLFELSCNYIKEDDFKVIINAFKSTKTLIFFAIKSIHCFSEDTVKDIATIIAENKTIQYLEISDCNLKQTMVIEIARSIKELRALKQLSLNKIHLTCKALTSALEEKHSLEQLNLSQCNLQEPELKEIALCLKNVKLTGLSLSYNIISDYAAKNLTYLLSSDALTHLDMTNCDLQEAGMSHLINALRFKSIKYLNFSGSKITYLLATEISAEISNNPCVEYLDLSNSSVQEIGTREILTSLTKHTSNLKSFKISCSFSNSKTVTLFESVLESNKTIENLTLQKCNFEYVFDAVRKKVSTLQFLHISSSIISFPNLASILANNINLTHLNISNRDVQGELHVTRNEFSGIFLEHLNLSGNKITRTFAQLICNLISIGCNLKLPTVKLKKVNS